MANFELIQFTPHLPKVGQDGALTWKLDEACRPIKNLPQIFWEDGKPWDEANLWAHFRATSGKTDIKTIQANLGHLHKFAEWLEAVKLDWRHFPMVERNRVLVRWRKYLIEQRDEHGILAPSTASQRMRATIQFYRFAKSHDLIAKYSPMWLERQIVVPFYDSNGFKRTMQRASTDLSIPNRVRRGVTLENGLTPLSRDQMCELLAYSAKSGHVSHEVHLMLQLGFYSGARIETITDLRRGTLDSALSESGVEDIVFLLVGPNSRPAVATKYGVNGKIMVPKWLFEDLVKYSRDVNRLKREAVASPENKDLLFLTRFGNSYADRKSNSGAAIDRAMVDLRRRASGAGIKFAAKFHFHMTRATFGTWLATILLDRGNNADAVLTFVCSAMLHKNIETTLRYIKFIEQKRIEIEVANEFTLAFLGLEEMGRYQS